MPSSVTASEATEAGVLSDRPRSRSALSFAVGFVVAALLTAGAIIGLLSGEGLAGQTTSLIGGALLASLAISAILLGIVVFRLWRVARAWRAAATGARLHTRFVVLFSLAALTPAVIVAAFLGFTFSQSIENWFSQRVQTTIENAADVGRAYVDLASGGVRDEVLAMSEDLNRAAPHLTDDPQRYVAFLATQAERRNFRSAYVIDRTGRVLASATQKGATGYTPPSAEALRGANQGDVSVSFDPDHDRLLALYRLAAYGGGYVMVSRAVEPGLVMQLRQFRQAVTDYRAAQERQGTLRGLFGLAYICTSMLVLLGAIWVGLSSASRVAEPIGRLVNASRRVAAGDLKARVSVGEERDEVDALGVAFNRMTAQLETQRRDLMRAQEDAESRSRFIETVLGGVSAGVISLDSNGRITSINRSAAQLLEHRDADLVARRLIDVVPEFADLLNQPAPQAETPSQRVDLVRGSTVNLSVRMAPDAEGGLVLTFDDMTKLISAQRQEAWKDVARRIAHEIKNPLTPIQLSADRLARKYAAEITSDRETFQRCTDTILRQVSEIGRMVDEFAAFARMPTPVMAYADISEIAKSVVFGQRLVFPDIKFDAEGADKPIALVCDERLLGQALTNLVKNAAESVQGRRVRDNGDPKDAFVTLRLRDLETGVQFEVRDNGLGFPEKNRARLIEPYVTTRTKGTGLGLAIVARVVEDHGGLIELDDAPGPGPGAVVRFVLPKRAEDAIQPAAEIGVGAS